MEEEGEKSSFARSDFIRLVQVGTLATQAINLHKNKSSNKKNEPIKPWAFCISAVCTSNLCEEGHLKMHYLTIRL